MSKNSVYGVVLSLQVAKKARVVAATLGISRSKLIRDLLENYLETQVPQQFLPTGNAITTLPAKQANEIKREDKHDAD